MEDKETKIVQDLKDALEYSQTIINTVRHMLIVLDGDLRVTSANSYFYKVFKVTAQETEKQLIYNLGNGQWDIPKLRELLEKIIPNNVSFADYKVEHNFQDIGRRVMILNARRIPLPPAKPRVILLAIEDITEITNLVETLQDKVRQLEIFTKVATGRELKMIELKEKIRELETEIIKFRSHL